MTRRQYTVALLVMAVSGLIGGGLVTWLLPGRAAWAQDFEQWAVPKQVKAEEFVLVDEEGRTRGMLGFDDAGEPSVELRSEGGGLHAFLGGGWMTGGRLLLYEEGEPRVALGAEVLYLNDAGWLGPCLVLRLSESEAATVLSVADGEPGLMLYDGAGQGRAGLSLLDGNAGLSLHDASGQPRVVLGATETEHTITGAPKRYPISTISLFDETGRLTWQAP